MGNESLSKQSLEKLESMPHAAKIKLFHRLRIIELNKIIGRILANTVGNDEVRRTKARIIHQLYDGNFQKDDKFIELQSVLESGQNFYDQLNAYTTAAYANYYALFVKHAREARNCYGIEAAMRKAFTDVQSCVRTEELRMIDNQPKVIASSLLQAKYREAIIAYLEEDLGIKFNIRRPIAVEGQSLEIEDEYEDARSSQPFTPTPRRNVRDLERYTMNGEVFYLDADGEFYTPDQVTEEP